MIPDTVCAKYAEKKRKKKLTVQTYREEETGADMVLIEAEAEALEFLANVLRAQARFKKDCPFDFGPKSSGNVFFTKISTHGICMHRLPCVEKPGFKFAKS